MLAAVCDRRRRGAVLLGQTFVLTSFVKLGITGSPSNLHQCDSHSRSLSMMRVAGTFLGDYFGILMETKVEGFPFNVLENPMYVGSTLCFIANALWYDACSARFSSDRTIDSCSSLSLTLCVKWLWKIGHGASPVCFCPCTSL
jgi:hypothetical protein